jgi:oxygen-independent coproporphyrinogen-3 oxidase
MVGTLQSRQQYVEALIKEITIRRNYISTLPRTLYFGGGTPTLLTETELFAIFNELHRSFDLSQLEEVTIEANPEDISPVYLKMLRQFGINRISIGIQSFFDDDLKFMNRTHTPKKAQKAVIMAANHGFDNITVDLIYGLPNLTMERWQHNLNEIIKLPIQHFSAYHLGIEEGTVLYKRHKQGRLKEIDENLSVAQFKMLHSFMESNGWEHYEISNFAKPGYYSKHNSAYWKGLPYLGLGPSAHSYNGNSRQWNLSNVFKYIENIDKAEFFEIEQLSEKDKINDYIITSLRTAWGLDLNFVSKTFGIQYATQIKNSALPFIQTGYLIESSSTLRLSVDGMFISDKIFGELMVV